jgi:hypothetical protein
VEIPGVGELMLAAFPRDENFISRRSWYKKRTKKKKRKKKIDIKKNLYNNFRKKRGYKKYALVVYLF